jgi:1,4-alpha-glucan branching enzyme
VLNFTPVVRDGYRIGVPESGEYEEVINSDSRFYWGSDVGNGGGILAEAKPFHGLKYSLNLVLPPLACLILRKK